MDSFLNDGCNLSYNTNSPFSQPEQFFLNHAQASEVSVNMIHSQLVLTWFSVTFFAFRLCIVCYYNCFTQGSNAIWECGICIHQCPSPTSQMWVAGTKVCHIIIFHIHAHILYTFSSRYSVTQLQDVINKLASSQHPRMPLLLSVSALGKGKPETLVVSGAPDPLDEENYPDVQYWHNEDWIKHTEQQKDHGKSFQDLVFSSTGTAILWRSHRSRSLHLPQNRHGTSSIVSNSTPFPWRRRHQRLLHTLHMY